MDRIHEKASKFLNDVRVKKNIVGSKANHNDSNREQVKHALLHNINLSSNVCCCCQKIFVSPKFLLKHILRRHPENFISLHRKCLRPETNNNSSDSKYLLDFIHEEFSKLRREISIVRHVNKTPEDDHSNLSKGSKTVSREFELQQHIDNTNMNYGCIPLQTPEGHYSNLSKESKTVSGGLEGHQHISNRDMNHECNYKNSDDTISKELKVVKEKLTDLENNVLFLNNKFEGLDKDVKDEILSKQDIYNLMMTSENKILKAQEVQLVELRHDLQKDLHTVLNKQLFENNNEWRSQFVGLKKEIQRLDNLVDLIRKQINSPDYLDVIEKKLETHISNFLGSSRNKSTAPKTRNSALRKSTTGTVHKISSLKSKEKLMRNKPDSALKPVNTRMHENNIPCTNYEFSSMLAEKMSILGLSPGTSKTSCTEYEEKMKLIEYEKKQLSKQNKHFFTIYNKINMDADKRVTSKLRKKKCHKLRFSEPLTLSKTVHHKSSQKNFQNQTFPALDNKNSVVSFAPNKSVHVNPSQQELQKLPDSLVDEESLRFNVPAFGEGCDHLRSFTGRLKPEHYFQSTPLKDRASVPIADNFQNVRHSKDDCLSNSADVFHVQKDYSVASVLENSRFKKIDSNDLMKETSHHSKNNPEDRDNLSDESSLESLSSWEDYENNL